MDPKASTSSGRKRMRNESEDVDPIELSAAPIIASTDSTTPVVQGVQNVQVPYQSTNDTSIPMEVQIEQWNKEIEEQELGGEEEGDDDDVEGGDGSEMPDIHTAEGIEDDPFGEQQRDKKSWVWEHISHVGLVDGVEKVKCNHCDSKLKVHKTKSTSTYIRHLKKCRQFGGKMRNTQSTLINFQPIGGVSSSKGPQIVSAKFDMRRMREAAAYWIMMHEHPFSIVEEEGFNLMQRRGMPEWKQISRQTGKNDCMLVYETEKKKLKNVLANVGKISLTTDLWKSKTQKIEYMVVTGHWIDSDWKLQKMILNFINIPPPHTGREIAATLFKCAKEWKIESKVYTVSVDNASSNDLAITIMKEDFSSYSKLMCDGKIFHVRCCAHILNLLVQDGLGEIRDVVDKIRDTVDYINRSEARVIMFSECAAERNLVGPGKKLINDCKTRWNSTFDMLRCAYDFRIVFSRFKEQDLRYIYCPTVEDWEKVDKVCKVLEYFKSATLLVSGTDYPTANLFLKEVGSIKRMLDEKVYDSDDFIVRMVEKMKVKFDKYWGEVNLLMAIATVLDLTKKLIAVEYYYELMVGEDVANQYVSEVRNVLYKLYDEYASVEFLHSKDPVLSSRVSSSARRSEFPRDTDDGLEDFVRRRFGTRSQINELDDYLAKPPETKSDKDESLEWWKVNRITYKVLSQMARDILAIPLSTVASEAAFSAGTRVIDTYRGSLAPETVQALMCGGDWLRKSYGIKKKTKQDIVVKEIPLVRPTKN